MYTPHDTGSTRTEIDQIAALEREWLALAPRLSEHLQNWRQLEPALAPFSRPQQLIRFLHQPDADPRRKDAILAALLRRGHTDPQARRLVLQALLPGLKTVAAMIIRDERGRDDLRQLLLASVWERICDYPLARRPSRIAANLLRDARSSALRAFEGEQHRRRDLPEQPLERAPAPRRHDDLEAPLKRAVAARAITKVEAELILRTRIDRVPLAELAAAQHVPYDTLRLRRRRAERRLVLFLGQVAVRFEGRKTHSSYAREVGERLPGSAGRGAATHLNRRR